MKIILKLKEHMERKKLMKEIDRDFEEMGHVLEEINMIKNLDKVSKILT